MKKKSLRVICLFLSGIFFLHNIIISGATTSAELEKKKDALEEEQEAAKDAYDNAKEALSDIENEQDSVGEQIDSTNSELVTLMANVELIEDEIEEKESEIETTQAEYDEAVEQEKTLYAAMCERIKYMYEKGETTYVEILMKATSFSDLATKADYVEKLYEYDRIQLEEYVAVQNEKAIYKAQLEEEKGELETTKDELSEEQEMLEALLAEYKATYASYETEIANARALASSYAQELSAKTAEIASLDTEIAAAKEQEEAERKAAEEAAKKAAEEAAKKAAEEAEKASNSTENSDTETNSSDSGTTTTTTKTYQPAGEATGTNIANFACQFVGNPYVFGGTSLTDGCDCSGFVQSVYKEFGISVPRSSYAIGTAGTEVSYEDAQPGDVIVYPGHCAIYLGNGRIVHASSAKTGIKYGYALYRTITTVRRFV